MHTGVKSRDSLNSIKPNNLSLSLSNAIRVALVCAVCIPRKNNSTVAQYVTDSFSVSVLGSLWYISFTSYISTISWMYAQCSQLVR
jgi:hypothetical protein